MRNIADQIKSVDDAQYFAERRVPKPIKDYMRSGSGTRTTLSRNTQAFEEITFRPRAATIHPERDLRTTVLGQKLSMPVMIAPTGGGRLVHPAGEKAGARAAGAAGTVQWVTTFAGTPIEEIAAAATGPIFFQLYYPGSRDAAAELIERVRSVGCAALALTVDTAVGPRPEVPARGRVTIYRAGATGLRPMMEYFRLARYFGSKPLWTSRFLKDGMQGLRAAMVMDEGRSALLFRASEILTRQPPVWDDIPWIKERWDGPLVIKGILTPEDARRAVQLGADAIVVSNHGGNVLDGDPATISVLGSIVDAVDGRAEVLFDSGVRRGSDVVKALAIGARAVLIGRSWLWGLAAAGEPGVSAVLEVYRRQIADTLGALGCGSVQELDRSFVRVPPEWLEGSRQEPGVPPGLDAVDAS
jgi:isopentenyl diphosphate isomerase/L-lactate dehydrogenase-like FMN-dependent dehydrogenase